ncbi:GH12762 [Drosophila grimshawi]|uniref:GH12762 n=1 Tax=Drosophila grimshawi TaxID=7222 RepID=B4JL08_DROGR|nr:GH12762 [Drosophila grimshawi]
MMRYNKDERVTRLSPIWNSTYSVPTNITGMEVQLTERTQFQLHGGVFRKNRVNRFVIKGPIVSEGNDQVELVQNAFSGNHAGYPDIQIIGTSIVFIRKNAFSGGEIKLRVKDCDSLVLFSEAFTNMNMSCSFTNIRRLEINEKVFNPSTNSSVNARVNLHIEHSSIDRINRFNVSMHKIVFVNCTIGSVQKEAFDVTNINQLCFENCRIKKVEARAFTNKLFSEHVSITGTQIGTIDSEAIMGSGISKLTLRENTIDTIKENAIQVHSVDVIIEGNRIKNPGKNWLHVSNGDQITIKNNWFSIFVPINLNQDQSKRSNCNFTNNWLGDLQPGSLNFSICVVSAITVDRVCRCDDEREWLPTITDHDLRSELYCMLGERIDRCFNASKVHMQRYANEACAKNRNTLRCVDGSTLERYNDGFYTKQEREEQQRGTTTWSVIVYGFVFMAFIILLSAGIVWIRFKCCGRHNPDHYCQPSQDDCYTLRQAVNEMTDTPNQRLIKKLVSKLTSGKLKRQQCRDIICDLLSCNELPEKVKNLIARHLQEAHAKCVPQPSIAVAADDAQGPNDGFYASAPTDHIYSVPLLPSQYARPSDTQDPSAMPVYSEPINSANADDMPPAYEYMPQYATPLRHPPPPSTQQQLPSTRVAAGRDCQEQQEQQQQPQRGSNVSYATPVWRQTPNATPISKATTMAPDLPQRHVRDLRQDLEAMPQIHPNQLNSLRNQNQLHSPFPSNLRGPPPPSKTNMNHSKRSFEYLDGVDTMSAMELMDMRGAAALPPDSGSDHSGGSDETVKIEDIEYADGDA